MNTASRERLRASPWLSWSKGGMTVRIIHAAIEECPASRFIGRRYTPADSVNGEIILDYCIAIE